MTEVLRPVPVQVVERARVFIASETWIFARTMPHIPHFYIRRPELDERPAPDDRDRAYSWFVKAIRDHGTQRRWGPYNHHYLHLDGWKYWSMGAPVEVTTIVNRAGENDQGLRELHDERLIDDAEFNLALKNAKTHLKGARTKVRKLETAVAHIAGVPIERLFD